MKRKMNFYIGTNIVRILENERENTPIIKTNNTSSIFVFRREKMKIYVGTHTDEKTSKNTSSIIGNTFSITKRGQA